MRRGSSCVTMNVRDNIVAQTTTPKGGHHEGREAGARNPRRRGHGRGARLVSLAEMPVGLQADLNAALRDIDQRVMNSPEAERLLVRSPKHKPDRHRLPGVTRDFDVAHRVFYIDGVPYDRLEPTLLDAWRDAVRAGEEGPEVEGKWADHPVNEPPRKTSHKASMSSRGRGRGR